MNVLLIVMQSPGVRQELQTEYSEFLVKVGINLLKTSDFDLDFT
jgi:hypothetical protein